MRALEASLAFFVVAAFATGGCSGSAGKVRDAGTNSDVSQTNDAPRTSDRAPIGDGGRARDAAVEIPAEAVFAPPPNVIFPEAPQSSCAGTANDCELPPSACAEPSCDGGVCQGYRWVIYYDSPTCVSGKCKYTNRYFECTVSTVCSAGGCRYNGTALP